MSPCHGPWRAGDAEILAGCVSEEQKITLRAWGREKEQHSLCGILPGMGVGGWGWLKAQGQVTGRGAPGSLGLLEGFKGVWDPSLLAQLCCGNAFLQL